MNASPFSDAPEADQFAPAPEFVVMFLPGESLLTSALQEDPALLEYSMGRGVMLASPLTLIALPVPARGDRLDDRDDLP